MGGCTLRVCCDVSAGYIFNAPSSPYTTMRSFHVMTTFYSHKGEHEIEYECHGDNDKVLHHAIVRSSSLFSRQVP